MDGFFISEAALAGLRQGLNAGLVWLIVAWLFSGPLIRRGVAPRRAFMAGVALSLACAFIPLDTALGMDLRQVLPHLSGYVFFLLFFFAAIALIKYPSLGLDGGAWREGRYVPLLMGLLGFVYFVPEAVASRVMLEGLSALGRPAPAVYGSFIPAFVFMASLWAYLSRREGGWVRQYLGPGQMLLLMALIKLSLGSGSGAAESSLVPLVQRGVMKFVHDVVHQSFVYLMVPDHPMLKTTVWNFVGVLFGPTLSMTLALGLLIAPPAIYLYQGLTSPVHVPEAAETGAERRLARAAGRVTRRKLFIPVAAFIVVVVAGWYLGGKEDASLLYMPEPTPLIEDKGVYVIPKNDPGFDLYDGRLHKFSVLLDGRPMRIMIINKGEGGTLSVCLDACEICPPEGYGQRGNHVVCVYCMTPIPIDTLGRRGGCNPIPLAATVTERDIRVATDELRRVWNTFVVKKR